MHAMALQKRGKGENIAHIVIHDQYFFTRQHRIRFPHLFKNFALEFGKVGLDLMQEQGHFVEQPLGRTNVFDDDGFDYFFEPAFFLLGEFPGGIHNNRQRTQAEIFLDFFDYLEAAGIRQTQIQHQTIETRLFYAASASAPVGRR